MDAQTAQIEYDNLCNLDNCIAIGEENHTLTEAAEAHGLKVVEIYGISLIRAIDADGDTWLIGGNAMGREAYGGCYGKEVA